MGKWADDPQTRMNTHFLLAKSIFKSGQKVGKWPLFICTGQKQLGQSPLFRHKSGQENRTKISIFPSSRPTFPTHFPSIFHRLGLKTHSNFLPVKLSETSIFPVIWKPQSLATLKMTSIKRLNRSHSASFFITK